MAKSSLLLVAPMSGWALPLAEVPDPAFAGGMLGDGLAIDPVGNALCAPCDGELVSVAPTGHAVTLRADNGAELLLHVGIETVGLKGEGFESLVAAGSRVRAGELLLRFDLDSIARRATSLVTPLVVTNGEGFGIVRRTLDRAVERGEFLMELRAVAAAKAAAASGASAESRRVRVALAHGIHARPAALVARRAREFSADVQVSAHGRRVSARSVVSLMSLGVRGEDVVVLEATGEQAAVALDALEAMLGVAAHEDWVPEISPAAAHRPPAAAPAPGTRIRGVAAAPGIALGVAAPLVRRERPVTAAGAGVARESEALAGAIAAVRGTLVARADAASGARAEIVAAHLELLDDPTLADAAADRIRRGGSAGYAWRSAIRTSAESLRATGDELLAARADDLLDLEAQVLAALAGDDPAAAVTLPDRAIVLADQLLPSQLIALDAGRLAGICTAQGGPTSHVAILAAALGKPLLVGAGAGILGIEAGTPLLLDAEDGTLQVAPTSADAGAAERRLRSRQAQESADRAAAGTECRTADGVRIEVLANIGSAEEAALAVESGAEGCGLLRTEFLFLGRATAPDARTQTAEYQRVVDAFGGRPVVIRTLDAGNDKPIPYLTQPREGNPALGLRGIRMALRQPELLRVQLEAAISVNPATACRIMLPMVQARAEIEQVRAELDEIARRMRVSAPALGVMVETPSAAVIADRICEAADFVSIGTNDLTQYTLAMDRTHPDLAPQLDGLHPAVLRLIRMTAAAAAASAKPVAVCGSLAADPVAVPLLLGLGVQELSLVPRAIPRIKALVRGCRLPLCRELAERALTLASAAEVRELVQAARDHGR